MYNNSFSLSTPIHCSAIQRNSHFLAFHFVEIQSINRFFGEICLHFGTCVFCQLRRIYLPIKICKFYSRESERKINPQNHLEWILSINLMRWWRYLNGTAELEIVEMTEFRRCETIATSQGIILLFTNTHTHKYAQTFTLVRSQAT